MKERYLKADERLTCHIATHLLGGGTHDVSKLDTMQASIDRKENAPVLLKLGYVGNRHQSQEVFSSKGISRCVDATDYKHAQKIIQSKLEI